MKAEGEEDLTSPCAAKELHHSPNDAPYLVSTEYCKIADMVIAVAYSHHTDSRIYDVSNAEIEVSYSRFRPP